ncbi:MAG: phage portal protein [Candidatus Aminicenantes bacterium]|nr:phage portal protein [Candidatus Aminicenantes bacterium]NIQ70598.1 phage portal protein [Candidatus Aminicenantes bacterium]NIT26638.1 phage portal protein [Candidatus Aminicenantes bacterium]
MKKSGNGSKPPINLSKLDRAIFKISPAAGVNRIRSRLILDVLQNMGYVAGNSSRRSMRGWQTDDNSADESLLPELPLIRSRCRDLYNNTPLATGALKRATTNTVGPGLVLQAQVRNKLLKISDEQADEWERETEQRFNAWASSKDCDLTRTQNFYELQALAYLTTLMGGDCFTLMPRKERPGLDSDLRLAVYEGDFVSNPNNTMDTKKIAGGVEIDAGGAPVAYHFTNQHPNSIYAMPIKWKRVPAHGALTKRRQVVHLFYRDRPGLRRGVPFLHSVVESLKQLGRYSEAELMAAVVQAFFTVFVKQQLKGVDPLEQGIAESQRITKPSERDADYNMYEMGHGNVVGLDENEDVEFADPNRPSAKFAPFFEGMVRQIGSALEIPFEQLILHFTSSYSASRGALLEAWKFYRKSRLWLARNWCQPIYEEWLWEEVLNNRIQAPGFLDDNFKRYAWIGALWIGTGVGQIDPVKESKAASQKLDDLLTDYDTEYNLIYGGSWEAMLRRRQRQEKFIKSLDLARAKKNGGPGGGNPGDGGDGDRTNPLPEE